MGGDVKLRTKKEIRHRWEKVVKEMILYVIGKAHPKGLTEEQIFRDIKKHFGVTVGSPGEAP